MERRLKPSDLRSFVGRDWGRARESKERHWAAEARMGGPAAGLAASEALWAHARAVDPDWPTAEERAADLEHHLRLSARLARLADVDWRL